MVEREYTLITSVIGITTIAELESTPKDSDLVGRCHFSDRRETTTRVRLVRRDERDCESLPTRSRPIHNRSLQRHGQNSTLVDNYM